MAKQKQFMTTEEAFQIVYDLAKQNALDLNSWELRNDSELKKEAERQQTALDTVHDFIVNNMEEE